MNRPATGQIRFPSKFVAINDKSKVKIVLNGALDLHGTVEGEAALEFDGDEDSIIGTAQVIDPLVYLDSRRAMDADGDYSNPTFMYDYGTGTAVMQAIVNNTITRIGALPFNPGTFAAGGANLKGAPTNFPMMISEVAVLLTDTGECDIEMVPIDTGGKMGVLNAYPGNMGNHLESSVHFEYQTGSYNCTHCRMTIDKSGLRNRIRYLLGPRRKPPSDPKGEQHWDGSIDRTSLVLPVPGLPAKWNSSGEPARAQSEIDYGIREDTRIFDAQGDSNITLPRDLYLYHWTREAWVRLKPKTMVHLTPQQGTLPTFKVGDLITVSAGSDFHGGFSGVQRVMEYTYHWDENGVVELGSPEGQAGAAAVTTTADNEGLV